jgi:uncharacterized protein
MKSWLGLASCALAGVALAAPSGPSLVDLAQSGQTQPALAAIESGADVNAASDDGSTALLWAVHHDDRVLVERLLKAHADAKAANHYGTTPLAQAAVSEDPALIELLLKAGADPDAADPDGQTPLMVVAHTSNVKAAEVLLHNGAHVDATEKARGQTALHFAAAEGQPEMVRELLSHHADPNARSTVDHDLRQVSPEPRIQWRRPGGLTPLLYAAREGCMECVQALIKARANPNLSDPEGISPLLIATENFHFDVAVYLMKVGADPNHWDWWGRTPLYAAVDLNSLPYGGRPDRPSLDTTTSLKMIGLLLESGANPNAQLNLFPPFRQIGADRGADLLLTIGTTPLLRAAKAGDVDAMKLLLARGAKVDLANSLGVTPLMAAAGLRSNEIDTRGKYVTEKDAIAAIDLLVAAGADVNAIDNNGQSALYGAAYWGWNDVLKCLAGHRADLGIKDVRGHTAVDVAMGRAEGHGRGGAGKVVHEDSADLLRQLLTDSAKTADLPPVTPASQLL